VPWSDLAGISWSGFDLHLGLKTEESEFRWLSLFNVRHLHAWKPFLEAMDRTYIDHRPPKVARKSFGVHGELTLNLRLTNGVRSATTPIADQEILTSIARSGGAQAIENWKGEELRNFST
jgi:hypothetical protein